MSEESLPATVMITVGHSNRSGSRYFIRITDDISRTVVCEVEMSMADFATALGHCNAPGKATWRGLDRVGWTAENKTEHGVTADNLHEFEVDGWRARSGDIGNHHCRRDGGYSVVFFRHVPPAAMADSGE